jgi:prophage regulatory protein
MAQAAPTIRIVRLPEVSHRTALGRSSIYRRVNEGSFPRPVKIGPRAIGWSESAIDQWIADRLANATKA